jgi:PAS domain S-box-containing protein
MQNDELRRTQQRLERSRNRYSDLYDFAPVGYCTVSETGLILEANLTAAAMLGVDRGKLIKQPVSRFIVRKDQDIYYTHRRELFETGSPQTCELQMVGADDAPFWARIEAQVAENQEGQSICRAVISDVTQRKQVELQVEATRKDLQLSKAKYQRLAESIDAVLWEYDILADRWTYMAPQVTELLGYPPEAWTDLQFWLDHLHPEDRGWARDYCMQCTRRGESHVFEYRFLNAEGNVVWLLDVVSVEMSDDEPHALHGFMIDITERKYAEAQLEQYAADLKRSNEELEQFGYVVSHDLQEPLRMVKSYLELLERRYRDELDVKARQFIDYAVDGATRMQEMIRALLSLSRVETRGQAFEPTDVEAVLERTLMALGRVVHESGAEITHDPLPTVMADRTQLSQVFQNLIANAIKFRREGVPPRVHIAADRVPPSNSPHGGKDPVYPPAKGRTAATPSTYSPEYPSPPSDSPQWGEDAVEGDDGGEWHFSVIDNGIGIAPEQVDRIFRVFQRLHTEEEYPGLGMGLALCQRIVARHGGRIWVESQPGKGATFTFTISARGENGQTVGKERVT